MNIFSGIWVLVYCNALISSGYALSMPFFAVYLSVERGLPMSLTGAFLSISMLSGALANGLGGELSDTLGRRKVMLFALVSRCIFTALMALAIHDRAAYAWLLALHMAGGFFGMFFGPAAQAWIADHSGPRERLEHFGLLRIGGNLGWALGPMIGGLVASKSYALMFAITSMVYGVCSLVVFFCVEESSGRTGRRARLSDMLMELKVPRFARLCTLGFIISTVMSQLVVGLSLYCMKYLHYSQHQVGMLFSVNGFVVVFFQYSVSRLMKRTRISGAMAVGALLYALGYGIVGFSNIFLWTATGILLLSFGETAVSPGLTTLGSNIAPQGRKGRYLGMQALVQQTGSSFGIFLGGNGMEMLAPSWQQGPWVLIVLIALCAALGFYGMKKHLLPEEDGIKDFPLPLHPDKEAEI
jgi:MFS family permease